MPQEMNRTPDCHFMKPLLGTTEEPYTEKKITVSSDHMNVFQLHYVVHIQEEKIRLLLERLLSYSHWSLCDHQYKTHLCEDNVHKIPTSKMKKIDAIQNTLTVVFAALLRL